MATALRNELAVVAQLPDGDHSVSIRVERYYVEVGALVRRGDAVALLRSSRFVYDLPAEAEGVVMEVFTAPGTMVEPGATLLRLDEPGAVHLRLDEPEATEALLPRLPERDHLRPRITPLARRIAALHSLDLGRVVKGRGWIRGADVRAMLDHVLPKADPVPVQSEEQRETGLTSYAPPVEHLPLEAHTPVATSAVEVDLERAHLVRESSGRRRGEARIDYLHCVAYAAAQAMVEHRYLNSRWSEQGIVLYSRVDLHIETAEGPAIVIRDAADVALNGMARAIQRAARQHQASSAPRNGRTPALVIAVSQSGAGWWSAPSEGIPATALLRLASIQKRAVVVEEAAGPRIAVRERAILTLAYDARYISPLMADNFLLDIRRRIEALRQV